MVISGLHFKWISNGLLEYATLGMHPAVISYPSTTTSTRSVQRLKNHPPSS
jgi:hypothetical protein